MGAASSRAHMSDTITVDTGALIAIENRSKRMQALLDEIDRHHWEIAVPAGVVGGTHGMF